MELLVSLIWCVVYVLLALVALVLGLLLALLVAPVRTRASGAICGLQPQRGTLRLDGLWGAAAVVGAAGAKPAWQFRLFGRRVGRPRLKDEKRRRRAAVTDDAEQKRPKARPDAAERRRKPGKPPGRRDGLFWAEVRQRGLMWDWIAPALRALSDLLQAPRCERLQAALRFGTGDPAETGMLCGALWALAGPLMARPAVAVELQPDFLDRRSEAQGEVWLSVRPVQLLLLGARLLWRGPTWRTIKAYRAAKRRKRCAAAGQAAGHAPQERMTDSG